MSVVPIPHVITPRETRSEAGKRRWLPTCSCGWVGVTARTAEVAELVGRRDHAEKQQPPWCPTPGKRRFKTRETAEQALRQFWQTAGKGKRMPCRVYQCTCGRWHTTAQAARSGRS